MPCIFIDVAVYMFIILLHKFFDNRFFSYKLFGWIFRSVWCGIDATKSFAAGANNAAANNDATRQITQQHLTVLIKHSGGEHPVVHIIFPLDKRETHADGRTCCIP